MYEGEREKASESRRHFTEWEQGQRACSTYNKQAMHIMCVVGAGTAAGQKYTAIESAETAHTAAAYYFWQWVYSSYHPPPPSPQHS